MYETVTMREAARRLGVSNSKIWRLVKEGVLLAEKNPLDGRQKLIRVSDLEKLGGRDERCPRFLSDGVVSVPGAPRAADVEDYMRKHWQPR